MSLPKLLQKFFQGYAVLEEVESAINGKIEVREDLLGKKSLVAGGVTQSGGMVGKIWEVALGKIVNCKLKIENCLILGLGAGSAAKVVSQIFPGVKTTGVEIDPKIIRLGEKYFGLGEISDLSVVINDAFSLITNYQLPIINYDLILVDLYLGARVPIEAETDEFLQWIKHCLRPSGWVIFNRLYYADKKEKTEQFGKKLTKFFTKIEAKKGNMNKLFLCQR